MRSHRPVEGIVGVLNRGGRLILHCNHRRRKKIAICQRPGCLYGMIHRRHIHRVAGGSRLGRGCDHWRNKADCDWLRRNYLDYLGEAQAGRANVVDPPRVKHIQIQGIASGRVDPIHPAYLYIIHPPASIGDI